MGFTLSSQDVTGTVIHSHTRLSFKKFLPLFFKVRGGRRPGAGLTESLPAAFPASAVTSRCGPASWRLHAAGRWAHLGTRSPRCPPACAGPGPRCRSVCCDFLRQGASSPGQAVPPAGPTAVPAGALQPVLGGNRPAKWPRRPPVSSPPQGCPPGPGLVPALPVFSARSPSGTSREPAQGPLPFPPAAPRPLRPEDFLFFPVDLCLRRFPNIFLWILFYAVFHSEMCGNSKLCAYQKHLLLKQILSTTKFPGLDTPPEEITPSDQHL